MKEYVFVCTSLLLSFERTPKDSQIFFKYSDHFLILLEAYFVYLQMTTINILTLLTVTYVFKSRSILLIDFFTAINVL